jgi:octaprenyl-diphosphate synthase
MKMNVKDAVDLVIQKHGAALVRETERFLVEGIEKAELLEPMRYMLRTKRDYLRPSIISLSCETVEGSPVGVPYVSTAMSLACHSMVVFDDLIDRTSSKRFVPTLPEKFGPDKALLVAALTAAKAFHSLAGLAWKVAPRTFFAVNEDFQHFLSRMAEAEVENSNLAKRFALDPKSRLALLELESIDMETSARLGAFVGECVSDKMELLGQYGRHLGKAIRLQEDLECSLNLTLELAGKIQRGAFPYPLAWALDNSKRSGRFSNELSTIRVEADDIQQLVALLFDSGAVDHTRHLIREESQKSIIALSKMENGEAKDALLTLASSQERLSLRNLEDSETT